MKKLIATVLAVLLLCSMATACAAPDAATTPATDSSAKKAACILGVGGLGEEAQARQTGGIGGLHTGTPCSRAAACTA